MIRQQTYGRNYALTSVVLLAFIVSAVMGAYAGSGRVPAATLIRVPFFVAVAAALIVSLRQFGLAFALLPVIAAAVPVSIGTGTQSPIVAGLLFACVLPVLGVTRALVSRRLTVVNSSINLPLVALMLVWSIAYLYSDVDRSPMVWTWNTFTLPRLGQLGIVLVSAVTMLVAVNVGSNSRWIRVAVWTFVGLGVICLLGFVPSLARYVRFVNTGGLFTMWLVALAYGQALFNDSVRPWLRSGLVVLVLVWLYRAIFLQTIWFSGWLPSVIALAVITLIRSRRVFGIMLVGAVSAVFLNFDQVHHALWDAKIEEGDLSRLPIWAQAFDLTRQHLLLGTGPAGYAA